MMDHTVLLAVTPDMAEILLGGTAAFTLDIRNDGAADEYRITVEGIPDAWYELDRPRVSLDAFSDAQAHLSIHSDPESTDMSGRYPLRVQVTSEHDTSRHADAVMVLIARSDGSRNEAMAPVSGVPRASLFPPLRRLPRWAVLAPLVVLLVGVVGAALVRHAPSRAKRSTPTASSSLSPTAVARATSSPTATPLRARILPPAATTRGPRGGGRATTPTPATAAPTWQAPHGGRRATPRIVTFVLYRHAGASYVLWRVENASHVSLQGKPVSLRDAEIVTHPTNLRGQRGCRQTTCPSGTAA